MSVTPDLATLRDLLDRTQAATGSDHRLRLELSAVLLGGEIRPHLSIASGVTADVVVCPSPLGSGDALWIQEVRDWTGSLDAVVALIGRLLPGSVWHVMTDYGDLNRARLEPEGRPSASVYCDHDRPDFRVEDADTPALALCAALLSVMIAKVERELRAVALSELAASDAKLLP